MKNAELEESNPDSVDPVVSKLYCSILGEDSTVRITPGSMAATIYDRELAVERFNCNYGLNERHREILEKHGLIISGVGGQGEARILELADHRFFLATLFLPQFASSPGKPHPIVVELLRAAVRFCS